MKVTNKIVKLIACILSFSILVSVFTACVKKDIGAAKGELKITFFNGGYGTTWLEKTVEAYKNHNPNAKIKLDPNSNLKANFIETRLKNKSGLSDIYFTITGFPWGRWTLPSNKYLADLTEVFDADIEGVKFKDKLTEGFNSASRIKGVPYSIPWTSNSVGFVYNKTMLNNNPLWKECLTNGEYPVTMKEMMDLCQIILESNRDGKNIKPFVFTGIDDYWLYPTLTWWAQYSGIQSYRNFFKFESKDVFYEEGRYQMLRQFEDLIIKKLDGISTYVAGSESKNRDSSQISFSNGEAFMMPNGSWAEREMDLIGSSKIELGFMPVPLICDTDGKIIAKEMKDVDTNFNVDSATFNEDDYVVIGEGENKKYYPLINNTWSGFDRVIVPNEAINKDLAFDFLKFMATDEALEIYTKYTGAMRPFKYNPNIEGLSNFSKKAIEIWTKAVKNNTDIMQASSSEMITIAGFEMFNFGGNIFQQMWSDVSPTNAKATFDNMNKYLEDVGSTKGSWYMYRQPYGLPI